MKKLQSNARNMAVVLTAIASVSGGMLSLVNRVTEEPIRNINTQTIENEIKNVTIGDAEIQFKVEEPVEKDGFVFHAVKSADGSLIGTAVESTDKNGFGGPLKIMIGFSPEGEILGYKVIEHSETPGLGAGADEWFRQSGETAGERGKTARLFFGAPQQPGNHNIIGMNPGDDLMLVSKDGGQVDAITASTITSKAFLRAVNSAYKSVFGYTEADGVSGASSQN